LGKSIDELLQRLKLFLINQLELFDEVVEMFEARVKMGFFSQVNNLLKMRVVDVSVNSKQTLEDVLDNVFEVLWKRCVCIVHNKLKRSVSIKSLRGREGERNLPTRDGNLVSSSRMF